MEGANDRRKKRGGKKTNEPRCRRIWSAIEEKQLICALKELVTRGFKADNGFKSGYLNILEHSMAQAFPGTDLRGEPHINSKIHVWKKHYSSLSSMLQVSGIGLSTSTFMIEATKEIWDNYVKKDGSVRTMINKEWPLYNDWVEIFGKDRATGESAEAFADAVQDLLNNQEVPNSPKYAANSVPCPSFNGGSSATHHPTNLDESTSAASKSKGKGKKRKMNDELDEQFLCTMNTFCDRTDARMGQIADRMGELAQRVGSAYDAAKKREVVFQALENVSFLSMEARVLAAQILCNNTNELDLFFGLPDEAKAVLVKNVITNHSRGSFSTP